MRRLLLAFLLLPGCKKDSDAPQGSAKVAGAVAAAPKKIEPPFDLKNPPADATRRPSGLVYKTITAAPNNPAPKRNDTVMIKYTGWRQETGETFFSNMNDNPMPLKLATAAKGFVEGVQLVHKGEKAMLWLPPEIGLKTQGGPASGTNVYEVEVVDIIEAPAIPADLAAPPADAKVTKSGAKYITIRPGTGTEKARAHDDVTFNVTAWDAEGRMFDSTDMKTKPAAKVAPYTQAKPMEEVLTDMVAGQRVRFWVDSAAMTTPTPQKEALPAGQLVYEVEILQIDPKPQPPPTPTDVAKPPGDARKTAAGVFYKVLESGPGGAKPKATDTVTVNYTGWQTNGRMFDSSVTKGQPSTFSLTAVIKGWTDGLQLMSPGDSYRFWIPEELAYKDNPGRPQGMLVFDIQLIDIKPSTPPHPDAHPGHPPGHP